MLVAKDLKKFDKLKEIAINCMGFIEDINARGCNLEVTLQVNAVKCNIFNYPCNSFTSKKGEVMMFSIYEEDYTEKIENDLYAVLSGNTINEDNAFSDSVEDWWWL